MTAVELKSALIHKISAINDISFLKAIERIIDLKIENKIIHLSDKEKEEIIESKKEIQQGLFIDNENLELELKEWFKEK